MPSCCTSSRPAREPYSYFSGAWIARLINKPELDNKTRSIPAHNECHALFVGLKPRLLYLILEEERAGRHPLPEQTRLVHIKYLFGKIAALPNNLGEFLLDVALGGRCISRSFTVQRNAPESLLEFLKSALAGHESRFSFGKITRYLWLGIVDVLFFITVVVKSSSNHKGIIKVLCFCSGYVCIKPTFFFLQSAIHNARATSIFTMVLLQEVTTLFASLLKDIHAVCCIFF